MNNLPSYYVWQPSFESSGDVVSILLTRGACRQAPESGREFFEAVLSAAGVDAPLIAWGVEPFLTCYFTGNEWEECWDARLLLGQKAQGAPSSDVNGIPILVLPATLSPPAIRLPVRVLADFASRQAALKCRDALRQRAAKAKWNEIHYERYVTREIASHRVQLLVDVITVDRSRMQEVLFAAEEVMAICAENSGRTHWPATI